MLAVHIDPLLHGKVTGVSRVGLRLLQELNLDNDIYTIRGFDTWNYPTNENQKIKLSLIHRGDLRIFVEDELFRNFLESQNYKEVNLQYLSEFFIIYPFWRPSLRISNKEVSYIHDLSGLYFPHFHAPETVSRMISDLNDKARFDLLTIVPSNRTKFDVAMFGDFELSKLAVIHHGPSFPRELKSKQPQFEVSPDSYLFVGSLDPRRGIERLLDIWQNQMNGLSAKLYLIGELVWWSTPSFDEKLEAALKSQNVISTGYISDSELLWMIQNCRGLLNLSHFEGFGMPIVDAISNNVPAIAAANSSFVDFHIGGVELVDPSSFNLKSWDYNKCKSAIDTLEVERLFNWSNQASAIWEAFKT